MNNQPEQGNNEQGQASGADLSSRGLTLGRLADRLPAGVYVIILDKTYPRRWQTHIASASESVRVQEMR